MGWPINWTSLEAINEIEFWSEASTKAFQSIDMSYLWWGTDPSQTPFRPQSFEQQPDEHSDFMCSVPQQGTSEAEASSMSDMQEGIPTEEGEEFQGMQFSVFKGDGQTFCYETMVIPRVGTEIPARVDRLKAVGNGQVPLCASQAFRILNRK